MVLFIPFAWLAVSALQLWIAQRHTILRLLAVWVAIVLLTLALLLGDAAPADYLSLEGLRYVFVIGVGWLSFIVPGVWLLPRFPKRQHPIESFGALILVNVLVGCAAILWTGLVGLVVAVNAIGKCC